MMPDRTILILAVLGMLALLASVPLPLREGLGLVYGVQALRSHRKALRSRLR